MPEKHSIFELWKESHEKTGELLIWCREDLKALVKSIKNETAVSRANGLVRWCCSSNLSEILEKNPALMNQDKESLILLRYVQVLRGHEGHGYPLLVHRSVHFIVTLGRVGWDFFKKIMEVARTHGYDSMAFFPENLQDETEVTLKWLKNFKKSIKEQNIDAKNPKGGYKLKTVNIIFPKAQCAAFKEMKPKK